MSTVSWTAQTHLKDIPLPFMDIVLTERFLLPPDSFKRFQMPVPETVAEVAEASGIGIQEVLKILQECMELNQTIWLQGPIETYLSEPNIWIIDMRALVDFDAEPLHPRARIFQHGNQAHQLEMMRTFDKVIVLSGTPAHAWSAAMSLRQMNIKAYLTT